MKKMKGSITVEASLVMPVVILVVISVIYISFFVYDANMVEMVAYRAIMTSNYENKELHTVAMEERKKINGFCLENSSVWTSDSKYLSVTYKEKIKAIMKIPLLVFQEDKLNKEISVYQDFNKEKIYIIKAAKKLIVADKKKEK